jgi:hypothetical protein
MLRMFKRAKPAPEAKESPAVREGAMKEAALLNGGGCLMDYSNVAPGTPGYALYALEMDGLMTKRDEYKRLSPIQWGTVTTFTLTDAGKRAAAMLA